MKDTIDDDLVPLIIRPNIFEIDLDAVASCVRQLRAHIGPQVYFFATLKANAYGYGLLPVAQVVLNSGADALSLANLDDAVRLRQAGIEAPILVFAGSLPSEQVVRTVEKFKLIPSIYSEESGAAFARFSTRELEVAVKVDVGPERIGIPAEQAAAFTKRLATHRNLKIKIVHAHPQLPLRGRAAECLEWQYQRFLKALEDLRQAGLDIPLTVFASSKVLKASGKSMVLSAVDPGAALFTPLAPISEDGNEPFYSLKSRLIQVREVTRNQFLEKAPFRLVPGMRIGVIPFGYSDGLHRVHCGEVIVRGVRAKILGSPALEYCRIDLTPIAGAAVGDEVVIIGRQSGARISPQEVLKVQGAARVSDLALEIKGTVFRKYLQKSLQQEPLPCFPSTERQGMGNEQKTNNGKSVKIRRRHCRSGRGHGLDVTSISKDGEKKD